MKIKDFLRKVKAESDNPVNQICHLVYTPFTGLGKPGYKGDEWFAKRIEIFKDYTLKSLQNQSEQFFVHWISFRPEEQKNRLAKKLFADLCGIKWRTVFTFGGLCWWDDKYRFDRLYKRLKETLPALREIVGDAKYVYETVLASDDMYHRDVVSSIQIQPFAYKRALVHWIGYVYNLQTKALAQWNPEEGHLPPFYTIMYPADVFLDPKKHFDYLKGYKSHEDVEKLFDCVRLPDWRYCVTVNGNNISTRWEHRFRDKTKISKKATENILKDFGIKK